MIIGGKKIMKYTNHSGGAVGSDTVFENEAKKYNIDTIAYSFDGHNTISRIRKILNHKELEEGFDHVEIANKSLGRNIENISAYVKNLLSRNWFQVKNSEAIYAIGNLKNDSVVDGGTGWAVQMGIDNSKTVFVFEQNKNCWYKYYPGGDLENDRFAVPGKFQKIGYIPPLTENFAGIGTRDINDNGIKAVKQIFVVNFNEP
jgi:hypothetical protein